MYQTITTDTEFGEVVIQQRETVRNVIFRVKNGRLHITAPTTATIASIGELIEKKRATLRRLFQRGSNNYLRPGDIIHTHDFTIVIETHDCDKYIGRMADNTLHIALPRHDNYNVDAIQRCIARLAGPFLKHAAERFLPARLDHWAKILRCNYRSVSISYGVKRLGVCNSRREIKLSYHLMLLPDRLIDYVILHELAHLSEMNHGPKFHEICNRYCGGNEAALQKELRLFPFPFR